MSSAAETVANRVAAFRGSRAQGEELPAPVWAVISVSVWTSAAGPTLRSRLLLEDHKQPGHRRAVLRAQELLFQAHHVQLGLGRHIANVVDMMRIAARIAQPMRIAVSALQRKSKKAFGAQQR